MRGTGAIAGGVISAALKSVVEILLLADAGDVTGAGSERFITTCRWGNSVARASRCSR